HQALAIQTEAVFGTPSDGFCPAIMNQGLPAPADGTQPTDIATQSQQTRTALAVIGDRNLRFHPRDTFSSQNRDVVVSCTGLIYSKITGHEPHRGGGTSIPRRWKRSSAYRGRNGTTWSATATDTRTAWRRCTTDA